MSVCVCVCVCICCKIYLLLIADGGPRNVARNDLSLATRVHDICYMTSAIVWIKQVKSDYAVLASALRSARTRSP